MDEAFIIFLLPLQFTRRVFPIEELMSDIKTITDTAGHIMVLESCRNKIENVQKKSWAKKGEVLIYVTPLSIG